MHKIEKILLDATQYKGNKEPGSKSLSGSELNNELLQIWLRQKYGVIESDSFEQNTIGSLMHLSIQEVLKKEYLIEYSLNEKQDNGWELTGSIDLLSIRDREIIDIKSTKQYTVEKVLTEPDHQYIWQLSAYKFLADRYFNMDFDTKILFVLKDGGYDFRKMVNKPSLELINITPKSHKEVLDKFNNIVEQLSILGDEHPQQCKDLWWRKTKNGSVPVRCMQYCSYNKVCPYYKQNPMQVNF